MPQAEFEEKEYESAANSEFEGHGSCHCCFGCEHESRIQLWAPGQVLENELGFDALIAVEGDTKALERLLSTSIPTGFDWRSHFAGIRRPWRMESGPLGVASLFIQYKRPEYVTRWGKKIAKAEAMGVITPPFFQFELDDEQNQKLYQLSDASAELAIVSYAAPCFHRGRELRVYRESCLVLENSSFIRPRPTSHRTVGYDNKGNSVACSEPEQLFPFGIRELVGRLMMVALEREYRTRDREWRYSIRAHVRELHDAIFGRETEEVSAPEGYQAQRVLRFAAENDLMWLIATVGPFY